MSSAKTLDQSLEFVDEEHPMDREEYVQKQN